MKKLASLMMALAMILTLLAGCGAGGGTSAASSSGSAASSNGSAASGEEQYTLKMHLSVGTTDPVYSAAQKFADEVSEKTNGNVTIQLYASSSLGNTADCLEGLSMREAALNVEKRSIHTKN